MAQATTCSCSTAPATELKTLSVFTAPRNNEPVIKEMDGQLQQMTDESAGSVSKDIFGLFFGFFFPIWLIWFFSKLEGDRFNINSQHSKPQQGRIVTFFCLISK